MTQKKLLMIVNPAAGKTRSHGPLFDAVSVFCNAGYLVRVYHTTGRGDAARAAAHAQQQPYRRSLPPEQQRGLAAIRELEAKIRAEKKLNS